jgi:hypothetical protein
MVKMPFNPEHIIIGGIYNIRDEIEYEALGYHTDIIVPARHHTALVIGDILGHPGYWNIATVSYTRLSTHVLSKHFN